MCVCVRVCVRVFPVFNLLNLGLAAYLFVSLGSCSVSIRPCSDLGVL
jgi:hypothetical protein